MNTISEYQTFTVISCAKCGIATGYPDDWLQQRRDEHAQLWCPNGHTLSFNGKSQTDRERERGDRLARALESAQAEADRERRSRIAIRGHLTRQRKRAAAGLCPCCQRTFQQLARHMQHKHPEFATQEKT